MSKNKQLKKQVNNIKYDFMLYKKLNAALDYITINDPFSSNKPLIIPNTNKDNKEMTISLDILDKYQAIDTLITCFHYSFSQKQLESKITKNTKYWDLQHLIEFAVDKYHKNHLNVELKGLLFNKYALAV